MLEGPAGTIETPPPKPKPAPPKLDTSPAKAWSDAVAQARANTPRQTVAAAPGDTMTGIANDHDDTLPGVEAANPQIPCPNLIDVGQPIALPKKTPAQVVSGVNNAQVKPIITAMANANAAKTAQSWSKVKQSTYDMLLGNNNAGYPDVSAAAQVKQLNALEPGNSRFAAANNAALSAAKQQWTQMGVTKSQLSPIVNAYDNARQVTATVNRSLQNPQISHDPASVQSLHEAEQHANTGLSNAIQISLTNAGSQAARQAGSSPVAQATASAEAIAERADNLKSFGPNNAAFKTAVTNAAHDLQVTKPARQVANTYTHKGAEAAANELKTVTGKAGDPSIALQIIQASQPTISHIANDMNGMVKSYGSSSEFGQIYGDLSQSVNSATPISMSIKKSGQTSLSVGTTAADLVGKAIAAGVPKNLLVPSLDNYYESAAQDAIGNAGGSALTFATAAQLKQQGNDPAASYLVEGAANGFNALKSKTDSDLQDFSKTTSTPSRLQTTWAPFMTQAQMATATDKYLAANPSVARQANTDLASISQDGDAVVEAESAWNTYQGKLGGIGNGLDIDAPKDMSAAAHALTGSGDNGVVFAVSQSSRLNSALSSTLLPLVAQKEGSNGWQDWPGWSSLRSGRSLASATQKNMVKGRIVPQKFSEEAHNAAAVGLSALGLGLTGVNVYANGGFHWSSPTQAVYSVYSGLGFFKYGGEAYSSLAKANWLPNSLQYTNSKDSTASNVLKFVFGKDGENLTKSPAFKSLGFFYYGAGAFAAGAEALDDANSDPVAAGFDSAEALGNAGNAAKPIVEELFGSELAEDVGFVSSGIGLIAAAGSLGWQMYSDWRANDAYRSASSDFLKDGLGINPQLGQLLTNLPSNTSAALQQYAAAYHTTPGHLLTELNTEWNEHKADNVSQFLFQASRMPAQSNGTYARTQPILDGERNSSEMKMQIVRNDKVVTVPEPLTADSLGQLNYWSDVLFGNNQVG